MMVLSVDSYVKMTADGNGVIGGRFYTLFKHK